MTTPYLCAHCRYASLQRMRGLGMARVNLLFPLILAFWALWHCRHARPPDARAC